jgi:recombinational DNA repair ATPase RecF
VKKGDVSGAPAQKVTVTLKSINELRNINAIPDGSALRFGHQGMNVIYGENASGKSGYARLLKKACRARDIEERLLSNVFNQNATGPAQASFKISVDNESDTDVPWQDGATVEEDILSNICVFDSRCARFIVDKNNEALYMPYGTSIFPDLVSLMKTIRSKIENEKPKLEKLEYSDIPLTTTPGKLISEITHETEPKVIEEKSLWKAKDEKDLKQLKKQVSDLENSDPTKVALKLRNLKDRINNLTEDIVLIDQALSPAKGEEIKQLIQTVNAAEKAHTLVLQQPRLKEPLEGVGEKAWQSLYNAAKEYSITLAYPNKEFPVTEETSLCVLCMQPLEAKAKERMIRFKTFMEKTTKGDVEKAQLSVDAAIEVIKKVVFPKKESYKDILDEVREKYPEVTKQIDEYFPIMQARAKELIKALEQKTIEPSTQITEAKPNPKESIDVIPKQLEVEAQDIEKTANPEELAKKNNILKELEARKLFSKKKDEILKYHSQLKLAKKYDDCYAETEFTSITKKGKSIIKEALTPRLKTSLESELKELGVEHLPLKLVPSGEEGQTLHKIDLETPHPLKKISLSEILSEGEYRVVALAGFLAELQTADHESPIVLDDPVCSLDHKFMRKIAKRLVKEAAKRQVIIFTHDIAFLLELKNMTAESAERFFTAQTVYRDITIGKCMDGLPWHSMEVKDRLEYLRKELNIIKDLYKTNMTKYNKEAAAIYGLLRESWEAFIEEKLLNKTIMRHGSEVQTLRLQYVSVSNDDYKKIHFAMHNCSTWMTGHDKSKALSEDRPSPTDVLNDINDLALFSKEIGKRNDQVKKNRDDYIKTKQAPLG